MIWPTIAVIALAGTAIMAMKPRQGLGLFLFVMMVYPRYMVVSLGTIDLPAHRVLALFLLVRAIMEPGLLASVRRNALDYLVVGLYGWGVLALLVTEGTEVLENRGGAFMDMVLPYLAARVIVRDRQDIITAAKWAAIAVFPMAAVGVTESFTGWSPYAYLRANAAWQLNLEGTVRMGLYRANGPAMSIIFGLLFVAVMSLLPALTKAGAAWRRAAYLSIAASIIGSLSSMSSGPYLGLVVFCFCAALIWKPSLVRPVLVLSLIGILAVEVGSNRHFYYQISRFTFNAGTAWYRARLFEEAIKHLGEYWTFGYGFKDPGWGPSLDDRLTVDVCNHYVLLAVTYGAMAPALFTGILAAAVARMRKAYLTARDAVIRDTAWYVASAVIGFAFALWSVGLLSLMEGLFYTMIGVAAGPAFDALNNGGGTPRGVYSNGAARTGPPGA